jgi:hypothetical protein
MDTIKLFIARDLQCLNASRFSASTFSVRFMMLMAAAWRVPRAPMSRIAKL